MKRPAKYKTILTETEHLKELVEETGYATFNLYYSENDRVYKSRPETGVEIFGTSLKDVVQETIDYIVANRVINESNDKRKSKYTLHGSR